MSHFSPAPELTGAQFELNDFLAPLPNTSPQTTALVVVDAAIADIETLTATLQAQVVIIEPGQDGVAAIAAALAARPVTDSLHILSHGDIGTLQLGTAQLQSDTLPAHAEALQQWQAHLSPDADILFYGCNVGQGKAGEAFIQQLAQLTEADLAASSNLTGQGGDWQFEVTVGSLETGSIVDPLTQAAYRFALPIYNGKDYFLTSGLQTWQEAEAEAQSRGGHLVAINDAAESAWLTQTFGTSDYFWIGLSDAAQEGTFRWTSGEALTYTNWAPGEPNNFGSGEDYVSMNFAGSSRWNDWGGNRYFRSIIEVGEGGAGTISLAAGSLSVAESIGTLSVDVLRQDGTTGTVTVDYQTVDGTATAGSDYTSRTGTLTFNPGETRKTINIPIRDDTLLEGAETFAVTIDNVTGGAALLAPRTTNITIQDSGENLTYNGHEYRLTTAGKTWAEAQEEAVRLGGYLVAINDAAESTWLRQTFGTSEYFWIGLTDEAQEGTFRWTSGEALTYTNWAPGEPNNFGSGEDYVSMNFQGSSRWNDWSSNTFFRGIIEIGDPTGSPPPGSGDGLKGTYYDNADFTNQKLERVDRTVNFDWGNGAPAASLGSDTFSVRWQGQIEPLYSETYTFRTTSDDGVQLWIDDQKIIDKFFDQAATNHTGQITLQAGRKYDIRMDYYENQGGAVAKLAWSSPSQPLQIVPQSQLYSDGGGTVLQIPVKENLVSGLVQPTAVDWLPDNKMLIAEQRGVVKLRENGTVRSTPFIDISAQVNGTRDRGLLDIAVYPNFSQNPYVYLLFTHDPPEVYSNASHPLAGPDKNGNRAGRLIRVTADASNGYRTAVPGSEVVLLGKNSTWNNFNGFVDSTIDFNEPPAGILPNGTNLQDFIATDSQSHTVGGLEFGKDGKLYVSIGDGTSYNRRDPRTVRVQDIDNLSGKVLRIDPITGKGLTDNPFYNGNTDANRSKVFQYGMRNPFRTTVHPDTGKLYIGDVGWNSWEEINTGSPSSNFGWPYFEGGSSGSVQTPNYKDLPEAQAFYASGKPVVAPFLGLSHASDNVNAIVMGDIYTGSAYPSQYRGDLFFSELYRGWVRHISFDASGNIADIGTFTTGAEVVVQIAQGPDGHLYYVDLDDGQVGRWVFQSAPAARLVQPDTGTSRTGIAPPADGLLFPIAPGK